MRANHAMCIAHACPACLEFIEGLVLSKIRSEIRQNWLTELTEA